MNPKTYEGTHGGHGCIGAIEREGTETYIESGRGIDMG